MIIIGTDAGIYRWIEGSGWPVIHSLQERAIVGLDSPGGGVLVAIDRDGEVLETVDNGQEWRAIPLPEGAEAPSALAVWASVAPMIVLATRPTGLYVRAVGAPIPGVDNPRPRGLIALLDKATSLIEPAPEAEPADPEAVRLAGWLPSGSPDAPGATAIRLLTVGTGSPAPWFASFEGAGLWRSLDDGATWGHCPGLPAEVHALRFPRERPGWVYAATSDGFWVSADAGGTWERRGAGLEGVSTLSALDVKPGDPDVLFAGAAPPAVVTAANRAGGSSIFESTDGGKAWALVKRGNPEVFPDDRVADIRFDPAAPDNVVVGMASGELWLTRNGGAYWSPLARQTHPVRVLCAVG